MKPSAATVTDDLDQYGHLYSDELREEVVKHYAAKFRCQGDQATNSLAEAKTWIAGTAGATTRSEKTAILEMISKSRQLR